MKVKTGLLLLLVFAGLNFLGASPGYCQDIIALASGGDHTVALRVDKTVWTWGRNANAQLGDGSWTNKNVPTRVAMLRDIVSVAAGDAHSLAVRADGTVWAWGWNANGQLGDGTTTDKPTPVQVKDPSDSSGFLADIIAVAAGERHSLALKANGAVWAWGYSANCQLGDGTCEGKLTPVRVKDPSDASGFLTGVKAIAAGSLHSIALKNDKTVWTWGSQGYMQLGRNSSSPPQNVAGQVAGLTNVIAIAGGWEHTVVLKGDNTVWAAGRNLEGQLGDGTTIGSSLSPLKLFVQVIDSGSRPLTFQITSTAGNGTLTGTPPALTYTSAEQFIGQDAFAFAVNNGLETSPPALIKVNVSVNPQDAKPPKVTGTSPKAGAAGVHVTAAPIQSNPNRFAPQITAVFSELLDASTVTGSTFTLNGGLTGQVLFDDFTRTAYYIPTKALNYSTTYTARLTTGIKDKKGNPLAAEYSWQFTTESLINLQVALPDLANEINFGEQAVNILSPAKTVSLASTGIQNLNIGTVSVIGANSNDFKVVGDTCSGKTFTPSQNCTVQVTFQPISAGQRTGSLSIPSNDPDLPSATVLLKGQGIGSGPPWFIWLPLIMQP